MKPLSPFFKYFGSKFRTAKRYPAPRYSTIVEPFAGGAGYALNYYERDVLLNDSDPRVVSIWKYLIAAEPDQIMSLPLMEPGQHINTLDVTNSERLLISCCVNSSQFRNVLTAWKNGQNDGLWCAKWREKIARQVPLIKHWRVSCGDYSLTANDPATWFIDPPYQALASHYKEGAIDFAHLGRWCQSLNGQVIVCEQDGATWLPFEPFARVATVRNLGDRMCGEAIWHAQEQREVEPVKPSAQRQTSIFDRIQGA